jgi:OmpA family
MKNLLFFLLCLSANTVFAQSTETVKSIYFATAKHDITPESEAILTEIIAELTKYETYTITIQGNTDDKGNNKYNKALSERRANATKDFLISNNIVATSIELTAYGEEKPVADNVDETGKQRNRRVDVFVRGVVKVVKKNKPKPPSTILKDKKNEEKVIEVVKKDTFSLEYWSTILRKIEPEPEFFDIDPTKDATIKGKQGTVIFIKAGTFKTRKDCLVNFYLLEMYDKSDMVAKNIGTQDNTNNPTISEGNIRTSATDCKGNPIKIQANKQIVVNIPTKRPNKDTHISSSTRINPIDSALTWTLHNGTIVETITLQELLDCSNTVCCGSRCQHCNYWRWFQRPLVVAPEAAMSGLINKKILYYNKSKMAGYRGCRVALHAKKYKLDCLKAKLDSTKKSY